MSPKWELASSPSKEGLRVSEPPPMAWPVPAPSLRVGDSATLEAGGLPGHRLACGSCEWAQASVESVWPRAAAQT